MPQRDIPDDGPIPTPLQQTYDKRFAQNGKGAGRKGEAPDPDQIPDPMQTAIGYIGADAFHRKAGNRGRRTGGGGMAGAGAGGSANRGPGGGKGPGKGGGKVGNRGGNRGSPGGGNRGR